MDEAAFKLQVSGAAPIKKIFSNPGGGTSEIVRLSDDNIYYKRGKSTFRMSFNDIFNVWRQFQGREISSSDLRTYKPTVFDSSKNGHSCNCTFLLTLLNAAGLADKMSGSGMKGNPFRARLFSAQCDSSISDV